MANIAVNINCDGYSNINDIEDSTIQNANCGKIIYKIDEGMDGVVLYRTLRGMLMRGNKVILLMKANSHHKETLCNLMMLYGQYNIYFDGKDDISDVKALAERDVSQIEVQQFAVPENFAFSGMEEIIYTINKHIKDGDLESLSKYVDTNREAIMSLPEAVSLLKVVYNKLVEGQNIAAVENSGNIEDQREIEELKSENKRLYGEIRVMRDEADKSKALLRDTDTGRLKVYETVRTGSIGCKADTIMYFKETSYVRYINTFIMTMMYMLERKSTNGCRLIIYDDKRDMTPKYNGLPCITARQFTDSRRTYIRDTPKFTITEPLMAPIEEILKHNTPHYDVVVIYDRMMQAKNMVEGNNVYRFLVSSSISEVSKLKTMLGITANDRVITHEGEGDKGVFYIPRIEGYSGMTDAARKAKYKRLEMPGGIGVVRSIVASAKVRVDLGG